MKPAQVIERLIATTSRNEKERIIKEAWNSGCLEFFKGAILAYNSLIVFGVQQVAKIEESDDDDFVSDYSWAKFEQLASKLSKRKLTGNAARNAIFQAANEADVNDWNFFYRSVLLKDLRAGITETTINKVLKSIKGDALNYIIPEFACQLAVDAKNHPTKLTGIKYCDVKMDGVRILTVIDKPNKLIRQFTRNGKENTNFPNIVAKLEQIIDYLPGSIVLDGEMVSKSFQLLMTQVNRKENVDTSDARLALFDIIPLDDFLEGHSPITQDERHETLSSMAGLFSEKCGDSVFVLPKLTVNFDTKEGQKKFEEFNIETLKAGFEGIMIKNPESPYSCDRKGYHWLKYKPTITLDLEVIGYEEGTGKNQGRLGALLSSGLFEDKKIDVSVGGGYTDQQRIEIWRERESVIGKIIEVEADVVSQNKDGTYSLRFPRFVRWRGFENGEKI